MSDGNGDKGVASIFVKDRRSSENGTDRHQETLFVSKKRGLNVTKVSGKNEASKDWKSKGQKYEKHMKKKCKSSYAISQSLSNEKKTVYLDIEGTQKSGKKKRTSPWLFNLRKRKKVSKMNSLDDQHLASPGLVSYKPLQGHSWQKMGIDSRFQESQNTTRIFSPYCTTVRFNGWLPTPRTLQSQADDAIRCFDIAMSSVSKSISEEPKEYKLPDVSADYVIELIDKVLSGGLNFED